MKAKKMFNCVGKDVPRAFLTTTMKKHNVFRMYLNVEEILDQVQRGNTVVCVDIPADGAGNIRYSEGRDGHGKPWKGLSYYAWARAEKEEVSNGVQTASI